MTALAHGDETGSWGWDTIAVTAWIVLAAGGYLAGLRVFAGRRARALGSPDAAHPGPPALRAARAAGAGARRLGRWRVAAFATGLLALAAALLPPLDHLADERFSAHMGQHMLLMVVAAPLLAAGAPGLVLPLVLPPRWRARLAALRHVSRTALRPLYLPVTAWAVHSAVLWIWHLPAAYDLALDVEPVHVAEHACFLAAAWLLWWHVVTPTRHRLCPPVAMLYMFVTALPAAALGAVLTLAPAPLYPSQAAAAAASGVNPLTDQQLAGLVMWVPADVVYFAAIVVFFLAWMGTAERGNDAMTLPSSSPGEAGR
ncbi:cytochrome c oxidase assembly protein [Microtetraspora niveoalba]|uniref:cytochrome c oxidase assembly protein n=1 Tax=Microtetraspora niveoalba TaxID=46175 RepID=UPI00083150E3|nr:cytochrome c oxidase assembly protein [Microtetraspora niveoalba]